ncbi:MAG TPA: efflux RND transporter periplasmic adaptor subunit, partial [Candidatus Baltobacteraceae bacterium]|nr:efflux RND transporter periplasmic adaptor subunit [Candidatus Baltobacteraceae bacterium]
MRRYRSLFIILALVALVAVAIVYALRPKPVAAETATVRRASLETGVEVEAKTRVRDPYVIAAPVSGRLGRIDLREGDTVRANSLIASIDPLPATASVQQALAQLDEVRAQEAGVETMRPKAEAIAQAQAHVAAAQAASAQAGRDLDRARSLAATGDISRSQLEAAQLLQKSRAQELAAARAALAEANAKRSDPDYLLRVYGAKAAAIQAQLRTLEDQASRTAIHAPAGGTVLRVLQRSETTVAAGTPLVQLADLQNLEIVADVLSEDAVDIHPGDAIIVERGAGNARVQGRVTRVEPSARTKVSALGVEEQRVDVIGRFTQLPRGIGDQYRLDVRIVTWRGPALRIPMGSLFRCAQAWCAYKVENGKAKRVTVTLGHRGNDAAEVVSGLRS